MGPVTGENSAVVPVTIDQVVSLLRDDAMRGFRIDIETDQLVQADEDAEKQRAVEFVTAVGQFLGEFGPMVVQMPPLAKMASSMLTFAVRRFKTGRELEDVIEQTMDEISQKLGNPAPQQMNPEDQAKIATAQANLKIAEIRAQAEGQKAEIDAQSMVQASQADAQSKADRYAGQADAGSVGPRAGPAGSPARHGKGGGGHGCGGTEPRSGAGQASRRASAPDGVAPRQDGRDADEFPAGRGCPRARQGQG
jgi:hypothetical protein